jgi:hypothetical protein
MRTSSGAIVLSIALMGCAGTADQGSSYGVTAESTVPSPTQATAPESTTDELDTAVLQQLATDCVEYTQLAAFLGDSEAQSMMANAESDEANLREACGSMVVTDVSKALAMQTSLQELEAAIATTTPTTLATTPPPNSEPISPVPVAAGPVMPYVICMDLQSAQDAIQAAGVFFSRSVDATGAGRMQISDRNWLVVAQDPAPGEPIGEAEPVLGVIKFGEGSC